MQLNKIFADNMVFAFNKPVRIYGSGCGKAEITFAGISKTVISDKDTWLIEFPPMSYGGPYSLTFDNGKEKLTYSNIYIGEVYLFAGQSNMKFKLKDSSTPSEKYETSESLRLFSTDRIEAGEHFTSKDGWVTASKDNVGEWSAIGYLTSRELVKKKNIAIGAVSCYQGASVIESWLPENVLKENGIDLSSEKLNGDHYHEIYGAWNGDGVLYNFALSQVIPFSLSGIVWYQGESDFSAAESPIYFKELSLMIDIWRKDFMDESLPFIVIQISDYLKESGEAWSLIQKAQYDIQFALPYVKSVISADVCENDTIHPPTKDKLSERIAQTICKMQ